jgi:hypothetical protein
VPMVGLFSVIIKLLHRTNTNFILKLALNNFRDFVFNQGKKMRRSRSYVDVF